MEAGQHAWSTMGLSHKYGLTVLEHRRCGNLRPLFTDVAQRVADADLRFRTMR
jgi:hypothetical protein